MRITVGLPIYAGTGGFTVRSLLSLQSLLIERGIDVDFDIEVGGSIIPKVRNRMAKRFLDSGNDYLVFIDSDMVFDANDVLALIASDFDVCGINYLARKKNPVWMNRAEDPMTAIRKDGRIWVKTEAAGTGLLAIHHRAMTTVAKQSQVYDDSGPIPAIFEFKIEDGRFFGEDYLFCRRWRDMGGEIWTLADATTGHIGETSYTGNFCDYLGGVNE